MQIIGKINCDEYAQMDSNFQQQAKKDYMAWAMFKIFLLGAVCFFTSIAFVGASYMMMYNTKTNLDNLWPYVLLSFVVMMTISVLLTHRKYNFDPYDFNWPQNYRYFSLTKGKTIIKDIVSLDNACGGQVDLEVSVKDSHGVEENIYVGSFDVELCPNIKESTLDLQKEKLYVPYLTNDIKV